MSERESEKALCRSKTCRPDEFGGPRQVEPGRPMCRTCADRLGPNLRRLAEIWPDLEARLAVEGRAGEKVTGTKIPGIVINLEVSDLAGTVTAWVRVIVGDVLARSKSSARPADHDTATLLAWLGRWHAWRLAYSENDDYALWVVEWASWYRSEVRRVAYPSGSRRVDIPGGRCLALHMLVEKGEPVEAGEIGAEVCGGQLYAIVRDGASLLPSEIVCSEDDAHRIPSGKWVQYMRALERANNAEAGSPGELSHR